MLSLVFWKFGNGYKQLRISYEIPFSVPAENRAPIISARDDSGGSYTGKSDSISYIKTIFLVPAENMAPIISARYDSGGSYTGKTDSISCTKIFSRHGLCIIFRPRGPEPYFPPRDLSKQGGDVFKCISV